MELVILLLASFCGFAQAITAPYAIYNNSSFSSDCATAIEYVTVTGTTEFVASKITFTTNSSTISFEPVPSDSSSSTASLMVNGLNTTNDVGLGKSSTSLVQTRITRSTIITITKTTTLPPVVTTVTARLSVDTNSDTSTVSDVLPTTSNAYIFENPDTSEDTTTVTRTRAAQNVIVTITQLVSGQGATLSLDTTGFNMSTSMILATNDNASLISVVPAVSNGLPVPKTYNTSTVRSSTSSADSKTTTLATYVSHGAASCMKPPYVFSYMVTALKLLQLVAADTYNAFPVSDPLKASEDVIFEPGVAHSRTSAFQAIHDSVKSFTENLSKRTNYLIHRIPASINLLSFDPIDTYHDSSGIGDLADGDKTLASTEASPMWYTYRYTVTATGPLTIHTTFTGPGCTTTVFVTTGIPITVSETETRYVSNTTITQQDPNPYTGSNGVLPTPDIMGPWNPAIDTSGITTTDTITSIGSMWNKPLVSLSLVIGLATAFLTYV